MKRSASLIIAVALGGCAGLGVPRNTDFTPPNSAEITRSFAIRDRYHLPKHIGGTAIFIDSVAVHHTYDEASTVVWKDRAGVWQWSQVSETGPGGLLSVERRLNSNSNRPLTAAEVMSLERLLADQKLYCEKNVATEPTGVGAPAHVMSIVSSFGRRTISWEGRLGGVSGAVADIALGP